MLNTIYVILNMHLNYNLDIRPSGCLTPLWGGGRGFNLYVNLFIYLIFFYFIKGQRE